MNHNLWRVGDPNPEFTPFRRATDLLKSLTRIISDISDAASDAIFRLVLSFVLLSLLTHLRRPLVNLWGMFAKSLFGARWLIDVERGGSPISTAGKPFLVTVQTTRGKKNKRKAFLRDPVSCLKCANTIGRIASAGVASDGRVSYAR